MICPWRLSLFQTQSRRINMDHYRSRIKHTLHVESPTSWSATLRVHSREAMKALKERIWLVSKASLGMSSLKSSKWETSFITACFALHRRLTISRSHYCAIPLLSQSDPADICLSSLSEISNIPPLIPPGLFPYHYSNSYPGLLTQQSLVILQEVILRGLGKAGQSGHVWSSPVFVDCIAGGGMETRGMVYFATMEHRECLLVSYKLYWGQRRYWRCWMA